MAKRWILIVGAVLVVLLLAAVALPFVIDINRFRPELEAKAAQALGRKVTFGTLRLSILSGKIFASDIAIADDPAFSSAAFLTAKSVRIGIEVKPLIVEKKLNITSITIDQPQIVLLKASDGTWNFSSLDRVSPEQKNAAQPPFVVRELHVKDGTLTIGSVPSAQPAQVYDHFSVDVTDFSPTSRFGFDIQTQLPGGGSAALSGKVGPINTTDAARTNFEATLKGKDVHLAALVASPASGIDGVADLDETVTSDGTVMKAAGVLSGSQLKFSAKTAPLPKAITIRHAVSAGLEQQAGVITIENADVAIGRAHLLIAGAVPASDKGAPVTLKLHGSKMPLDDLQPLLTVLKVTLPKKSHFRGGTASLDLVVTGTGDAPKVAGSVQLDHTTLVGFNLGAALGSTAAFAGKAISKPDTTMNQLTAKFVATNAGVKVQRIRTDIEGIGVSTGSGTVDPKGNQNFQLFSSPTGGVVGGMTKMTSIGDADENTKGWLPVAMKGTSEDPIFIPDTKAGAHNALVRTANGTGQAIKGLFHREKKADTKQK